MSLRHDKDVSDEELECYVYGEALQSCKATHQPPCSDSSSTTGSNAHLVWSSVAADWLKYHLLTSNTFFKTVEACLIPSDKATGSMQACAQPCCGDI